MEADIHHIQLEVKARYIVEEEGATSIVAGEGLLSIVAELARHSSDIGLVAGATWSGRIVAVGQDKKTIQAVCTAEGELDRAIAQEGLNKKIAAEERHMRALKALLKGNDHHSWVDWVVMAVMEAADMGLWMTEVGCNRMKAVSAELVVPAARKVVMSMDLDLKIHWRKPVEGY